MVRTSVAGRWTGAAMVSAVVLLVIGWLTALAAPGAAFRVGTNYISDLGATECGPRSGRLICSPDHLAFNASSVLTGVIVTGVAPALRRRLGGPAAAGFGCVGGGLVWIGLVPGGVWQHLVGVAAALPVAGALLLVSGFRPTTPAARRTAWWRAAAGPTVMACSAANLIPGVPTRIVVGSEYASYLVLLSLTLAEGIVLWRVSEPVAP